MKRPAWRAPRPKSQRNHPMNCWWVAALSTEVDRKLSGRWLLDTPVEAIQAARLKDPRDPAEWEVSVKSDAAGVQARRALARWMERETDGAVA